jgi:hypothetical protein
MSTCVQKLPLDLYRPSRELFSCGLISVTMLSLMGPVGSLASVSLNRHLLENMLRTLLVEEANHVVEMWEGSGSSWKVTKCVRCAGDVACVYQVPLLCCCCCCRLVDDHYWHASKLPVLWCHCVANVWHCVPLCAAVWHCVPLCGKGATGAAKVVLGPWVS